ncbi:MULTISPECIES: V-type ATP synthase subunit F [Coprobacillaceae]|uniref:V-type ATP synthase subunit F n=1 Tax=Coprobacillaceae TaxID=2810280 RepID=UPI000E46D6DE|nr:MULTISPECIES: V-type ATP synthase subunit F [Coprobacillaceae]RHM60051.1 ATP synthase subunit F [Coprobacillus sp. AF33-1AC]RHS92647.1 ATP synthase subunit F [Erysipelatoclostridium sp. AM42-17]
MKFYLISDNIDTQIGLRLVGIEGEVVHKRREFLELLEEKLKDNTIGIILITTKLIELAPDVISEIKLKQQKPLLVEIPDRHGDSKIGETIDRYVSEAIGVKL